MVEIVDVKVVDRELLSLFNNYEKIRSSGNLPDGFWDIYPSIYVISKTYYEIIEFKDNSNIFCDFYELLQIHTPQIYQNWIWEYANSVYLEFYKALCQNDERYRNEVTTISEGSKMLLGAISGYVAAEMGIAPAICSAMGSAVLILISKTGVNAFCEYCSKEFPEWSQEQNENCDSCS